MGPKCNYGYATKDYEDQKYNLNKKDHPLIS